MFVFFKLEYNPEGNTHCLQWPENNGGIKEEMKEKQGRLKERIERNKVTEGQTEKQREWEKMRTNN